MLLTKERPLGPVLRDRVYVGVEGLVQASVVRNVLSLGVLSVHVRVLAQLVLKLVDVVTVVLKEIQNTS